MKSEHFLGLIALCAVFAVSCTDEADDTGSNQAYVVPCKDDPTRWCVETGTFTPPYNCIGNSCHHAANGGVDAGNDRVLSCQGHTSGYHGHTVNADVPVDGVACLADPQRPGGGPVVAQTCSGTTSTTCTSVPGCGWFLPSGPCTGTPTKPTYTGGTCCCNIASAKPGSAFSLTGSCMQNCVNILCGAGATPALLGPGVLWDVTYMNCAANNPGNKPACLACCDKVANEIPTAWNLGTQVASWLSTCKSTCNPPVVALPPPVIPVKPPVIPVVPPPVVVVVPPPVTTDAAKTAVCAAKTTNYECTACCLEAFGDTGPKLDACKGPTGANCGAK